MLMARGTAPQRRPPARHLPNVTATRVLTADEVFLVVAYAAGVQPLSTPALASKVQAAYPDWNQDRTQLASLLASLAHDSRVLKLTWAAAGEAADPGDGLRRLSYWQLAPGAVHPPLGELESRA
jgi:hypothetical protein